MDTLKTTYINYSVVKSDNLTNIVKDVYKLNKENIGENPNLIYPDTVISIPVKATLEKESIITVNNSPDYSLQFWGLLIILLFFSIIYLFKKSVISVKTENFLEEQSFSRQNFKQEKTKHYVDVEDSAKYSFDDNDVQISEISNEEIINNSDSKSIKDSIKNLRKKQ